MGFQETENRNSLRYRFFAWLDIQEQKASYEMDYESEKINYTPDSYYTFSDQTLLLVFSPFIMLIRLYHKLELSKRLTVHAQEIKEKPVSE